MRIWPVVLGVGVVAMGVSGVCAGRHLLAGPKVARAAAQAPTPVRTVHAEGRVVTRPGKQVRVSAELQGRLVAVHVVEGQAVKKGQVLAELDKKEAQALLYEAIGSASEAYARMRARRADVRRSKPLVESGALPKQEDDRAREEKGAAEGRLVASNASAAHARALLEKTRIVSPIDGVIVTSSAEAHETVAPGAPLFVVADLSDLRVDVEVDEYDIGRVSLASEATVSADGFPGSSWRGNVEEIAAAVGPRHLRPQDPARPTDSSVLPVKVAIGGDTPLKLGQRVSVTFSAPAR